MSDSFFEMQLLKSIENARKNAQLKLRHNSYHAPEVILQREMDTEFSMLNFRYQDSKHDSVFTYSDQIKLDKIYEKPNSHNFQKSVYGGSLVFSGLPILKKRFVMPGSAAGTSIASKYLSKAFPQVMSTRILGTRVLGRAMGRAIPYVGWALIAIDVVELIIEENHEEKRPNQFGGFNNGFFGGGGSSSKW